MARSLPTGAHRAAPPSISELLVLSLTVLAFVTLLVIHPHHAATSSLTPLAATQQLCAGVEQDNRLTAALLYRSGTVDHLKASVNNAANGLSDRVVANDAEAVISAWSTSDERRYLDAFADLQQRCEQDRY